MRAMMILLVSGTCVLAADDVKVATIVSTNAETGTVTTQEFFTRGGQTNLVSSTTRRNGTVRSQLYRFYHNGKHAADHFTAPALGDSILDTYNGFDLAMTSRSNALSEVTLRDQYDAVLDRFLSTNGRLRPVSGSELQEYRRNPAAPNATAPKQTAK